MKTLYILQITKDKLQHDKFKVLRCLLYYILKMNDNECKHLVIEVHFDKTDFPSASDGSAFIETQAIWQLIVNGYNLLEPDHSKTFPLVEIDIFLPQIFNARSCLLTDSSITHVFFNKDTGIQLIDALLSERLADQNMPKLQGHWPIQDIMEQALQLQSQIDFGDFSFFDQPREKGSDKFFKYEETCMGGTFDHMHLGHKLLLTQACLLTQKRLVCGVTGDALLQKKKYSEFLEKYEDRCLRVHTFCKQLSPHIDIITFQLNDPIGEAGTRPDCEACILTREVEKGGQMINDHRLKMGLNKLDLVFADMILAEQDSKSRDYSNKVSSTNIRQFLSQQQNAKK